MTWLLVCRWTGVNHDLGCGRRGGGENKNVTILFATTFTIMLLHKKKLKMFILCNKVRKNWTILIFFPFTVYIFYFSKHVPLHNRFPSNRAVLAAKPLVKPLARMGVVSFLIFWMILMIPMYMKAKASNAHSQGTSSY